MTFASAVRALDAALAVRPALVASARRPGDGRRSLQRLRDWLRTNLRTADPPQRDLDALVGDADRRTRADGFHVLHDWDGKAGRFNPDTIPLDVATWLVGQDPEPPAVAAAILLDYYFVCVLALLSLRVWDEGDPDANLESLDGLLTRLHGQGSSGHRFASRAETLLLIATAHYEPEERGYHTLLEKVTSLNQRHRTRIALDHAVSMGCHLRFGFEATYVKDVGRMRDDNAADYPWLRFSVSTLMDDYARAPESRTAEAILNALSPDPGAFVAALGEQKAALLDAFGPFRPDDRAYSPLSFFFNFSHNVVKGTLVDALLGGRPWTVGFDDLLTAASGSTSPDAKVELAETLMGHARRSPDRIGGRRIPAIVYDPQAGRRAYAATIRRVRE